MLNNSLTKQILDAPTTSLSSSTSTLIADTGSTGHFLTTNSSSQTSTKNLNQITVALPNGQQIHSTGTMSLDIPSLPCTARIAYIFPDLQPHSLLSIGQLCDAGCIAVFTASDVTISYKNEPIIHGLRDQQTKLWNITVPIKQNTPFRHLSAKTVNHPTGTAQLIAFAHASLFSPSISTLQRALDLGYINEIPGLTSKNLRKYPPISIATVKGHLDQVRKNQRPTPSLNTQELPLLEIDNEEFTADPDQSPDQISERTHMCFATCIQKPISGTTYSDQTGRFSTTSSQGNTQLFVLYDYDSNSIHAIPMATRKATEILHCFKIVYNTLVKAGLRPKLHKLDNECAAILHEYMDSVQLEHQLVPPGQHRVNAAERAIRTLKNHLIAGFCTIDPIFPMHLWDRLVPQALLTLNLLRGSRINPKLSAYAQVFGQYSYNRNPIAPPGTHILIHEKPADRTTWAPHAVDAWYVGPAMKHYRCFRAWVWSTKKERTTDTLTWLPKTVAFPFPTPQQTIIDSTSKIIEALQATKTSPNSITPTANESELLIELGKLLRVYKSPVTNVHGTSSTNNTASPTPVSQNNYIADTATPLRVQSPIVETTPIPVSPDVTTTLRRSNRGYHPSYKKLQIMQSGNSAIETNAEIQHVETINFSTHSTQYYTQHFSGSALNCDTGKLVEYQQLLLTSDGPLWEHSGVEEWGRLAQGCPPSGIPVSAGTDTVHFIRRNAIPKNRKPTYPRIVVADRPQKEQTRRVRVTVGGDQIDYPGEVATKTSDLSTVKILINSTISTPGARFMTLDVKDFYLNTSMDRYEYMRVDIRTIPKAIIDYYNLLDIVENGYVYVEIRKGMYGLPQAGILANNELIILLEKHDYIQSKRTPGLFTHKTRPISFCLVVDDFGIKYEGKDNAEHLINILQQKYKITIDWAGDLYVGLKLDWDYVNKHVDISMPNYVEKALQRFNHTKPTKPQLSPFAWSTPKYGAKTQFAPLPDPSPSLPPDQVKRLQQIIGVFLYYARAVDSTMLVALGTLAASQTCATSNTNIAVQQFLDYAASFPQATVRYKASSMILHIHSDASYLSESKARSRAGGIFFLSDSPESGTVPPLNGAIHITSVIMKNVLASAAEAELAALFFNAQDACTIQQTLTDLGHIQPPTPLQTDNNCANGIINGTVKQKRSKAIDMRFYWLCDRVEQQQFQVKWAPGITNLGDYFTKHHPATHHQSSRYMYLHNPLIK